MYILKTKTFSKPKLTTGFTLIELLVVISIIGIITTVTLVSLNSSKEKAVNIKSITELDQLKKALELYRTDHGKYPAEGTDGYYCVTPLIAGQSDIIPFFNIELINKKYISAIPYYVTYNNDFVYATNKTFLNNNRCGENIFSSYIIEFRSDAILNLPNIVNDGVPYYCLGQ